MAKTAHLATAQLRSLGGLTRLRGIDRYYLAGASAIAFHLGLARVPVNGTVRRLMVDTGAEHTLLVPAAIAPGDLRVETTDAVGNVLRLGLGRAVVGEREVVALKAPSFPYFQRTVEMLGGNIHGLLGLSALGSKRVLFEGVDGPLRIEP